MRVIVFGGAGFLGSHVVDELKRRGHEVTVFDLKNGMDILDQQCVQSYTHDKDVVYNLAGVAALDGDPRTTLHYNVIGNFNVLHAAKIAKVRRYVYASTVYVFSKKGSYYGISKQAAERCVEESGLPYTILRYGTVYGPRSDERNRVYRMVKQGVDGGRIEVPGAGDSVREYIHVRDAAKLSVDILEPDYENKHITLTGTEKLSHCELASLIQDITGCIGIAFKNPFAGHYDKTPYSFSPTPSVKLTANPSVDIGQGILEMIEEIHGSRKES